MRQVSIKSLLDRKPPCGLSSLIWWQRYSDRWLNLRRRD